MASHWTPDRRKEQSKLAPKEGDWSLPGSGSPVKSRTRGNPKQKRQFEFSDDSDSSFDEDDEPSPPTSGSEDWHDVQDVKPAPTRLILEPMALRELVERNVKCPICKGEVEMKFSTVTIASSAILECPKESCSFIDHGNTPVPCKLPQKKQTTGNAALTLP